MIQLQYIHRLGASSFGHSLIFAIFSIRSKSCLEVFIKNHFFSGDNFSSFFFVKLPMSTGNHSRTVPQNIPDVSLFVCEVKQILD